MGGSMGKKKRTSRFLRSHRKEEIADLLSVWPGQHFSIISETVVVSNPFDWQ